MPIVTFADFRDHLGVAAGSPEEALAQRLYDAIGAQILRITNRDFEGVAGTSYTEVIRLRGAQEFTLTHIPVAAITSIAKHNFDGTDEDAYETDRYRLEDATHGRIRLLPAPEYVKVVYTTTGVVPADMPLAYLDWGQARWDDRERDPALLSYRTGEDSETYSERLAGRPPRSVVVTLLANKHITGGGVVR